MTHVSSRILRRVVPPSVLGKRRSGTEKKKGAAEKGLALRVTVVDENKVRASRLVFIR